MYIEKKIWEDRIFPHFQDNLIIHFHFPTWEDEDKYQLYIEIYWKKNKVDLYIPDRLFFYRPCTIQYTFQNGIIIKGTLEIKKFSHFNAKDTLGIFADFYYYRRENENYIWHTEGFLISFCPWTEEETIIIDDPVINDEEIAVPVVTNPTTSHGYSDLFPYIYLSGWPSINETARKWNFFSYIPITKSPPSPTFIDKLTELKSSNDRKGMQAEAVLFIEGSSNYKLLYVNNVNNLDGYIGSYLTLYNYLNTEKVFYDLVQTVCAFFETSSANFSNYLKSDSYLSEKERLWESYFALIIEMGYQNENFERIIKVITLCNFLETVFSNLNYENTTTFLDEINLKELFYATIILDSSIFPLPPYQVKSPPEAEKTVIVPYAIGNLQLVKYKLLRYELGEVASITSIMPGEKRKLVNRKLNRIIDKEVTKTFNDKTSVTKSNEQNNDFNEELWNAIAETTETTNYPDPGLVSSYGPPTNITIKGSFTKTQTTQTPDKKQLSSFAKKILNITTQRLSEKISKVRAHTELKELEDTSISYINNVGNKEPVYGIYSWLNKIYKAKVINYGNRMLFSFIIENPASNYIQQTQIIEGINLQQPQSLIQFNPPVKKYTDLNETNYLEICQYYELKNFTLYPQNEIVVSDVINLSQSKLIALPTGYVANSASLDYAFGSGTSEAIVSGFIGQKTFSFTRSKGVIGTQSFNSLNKEQNTIATSVVYNQNLQMSPPSTELDFQIAVEIVCVPSPDTILTWQIEMYQLLFNAYTTQTNIYYAKVNDTASKKQPVNPLTERFIVKQELEKSIQKQLLDNALIVNGLDYNLVNSPSNPSVQYNQLEILQYLNMSLEWNEMSYTFFDQYNNQNNMYSVSALSPDFFSGFLKASYAQVIIPILPFYNYGFLYFLNTGIVWSIKDRFAPCFDAINNDGSSNPDQLSIIYELKRTFHNTKPFPEEIDAWEVLVPTSMQILQNKESLKIKN